MGTATPDRTPRPLKWATVTLAVCGGVAALRFGRDLLIPLVLAVLLALVLSGMVEALRHIRIPRAASALVLLLAISGAFGALVDSLWQPAQHWLQDAPRILRTIEHRIRPAQSFVRQVDAIARRASTLGSPNEVAPPPPPTAAPPVSAVGVVAGTGWLAGEIVMGIALTLLLLAAGPPVIARMIAAVTRSRVAHVLCVIDGIRVEVGRYYGTLSLINLVFGAVVGFTMWLLGMPNPMLWGALAGTLNFIPYLGGLVTLVILTLVSMVVFDKLNHTLMVDGAFLALAAVEAHIVEPIFLGRRLQLNPIVVLLSLWAGGWLWGVAGVLFAVPALVAARVAAAHGPQGNAALMFLSSGFAPGSGAVTGKIKAADSAIKNADG
ncbi:MAG: AI-2E family transporter, partial [Gammaproteobacteria bacterium]|nr:AI-2E family transporter [Gammaproteobacteria bacterium]